MGQANSILSTVSSATNLVLTKESPKKHYITGTVAQRILLPDAATIEIADEYIVYNNTNVAVTVADSLNANSRTVAAGNVGRFTLVSKTGPIWMQG